LRESSRRNLWVAACVIGFAVSMSCLLLTFKQRAAFDALQRERLQLVAGAIGDMVEKSLTFGLAFNEIAAAPEFLGSQKSTDALIAGIDVADAGGTVVYSTDTARIGQAANPAWRIAMERVKGDAWRSREGQDAAEAAVVRNSFGLTLGHVVVRYRLDVLDDATRRFAKRLAAWGAGIAVIVTVTLFVVLNYLTLRLERRLARIRAILAGEPPRKAHPTSLGAQAVATRHTLDESARELAALRSELESAGRKA
jgi:hypothetical protein